MIIQPCVGGTGIGHCHCHWWLSVCLLESHFIEDCCWVVLVSEEVMAGVVGWLCHGLCPKGKSGES